MRSAKIISVLLSVVLMVTGMTIVASARDISSGSDADIVAPAYVVANTAESNLVISGTTATCKSSATGTSLKSITAVQTLEKYWGLWIWNEVDGASWSKTVYTSSLAMSNSKSGLGSGTYRLKTVFTLTASDGTTETITVYSQEKSI